MNGAMSVLAVTEKVGFLNAPSIYMEKIAVGTNIPRDVISLRYDIKTNLYNLTAVRGVNELVVMVLYEERHMELIKTLDGVRHVL
ncbi:fructose-bisphosphatase class II [Ehrlichia minasensis]|uniref:fructose-bisphosphatase class II n=1 Tax=Ehrlichia minasensis TaxID=1242993 RepID=UPI000B043461|nr:fructose-bisphosphatase class II [Ehrlichia minasensis]